MRVHKSILTICLGLGLAISNVSFSQDYERIDATIELYPKRFSSAEELSRFISRDFHTEEEKVRAIYTWIIKNVAYEPDEYKRFNFNFKNYRERNVKEEKTRAQVIKRTLEKGIAVCEGYAMLFERLCELQHINSYLVRGDIKTNFNDIGRPFKKVHMWNVAIIDARPYLFDPTWGAGKYQGKFIPEPSYFYYKTPPDLFLKTHYPDLAEDTYVAENIAREEFAELPLIIDNDLLIEDVVEPAKGVISSTLDEGIIRFQIKKEEVAAVSYSFGNEKRSIAASREHDELRFEIPIELGAENLLIYFNEKPALGYKIK